MPSTTVSNQIEEKLPGKKIFITFFVVLVSLTLGAIVALANENIVIVDTAVLNVRYGPGLAHDVMTQVEQEDRLFLLGEENKWYKVRLDDDEVGWVASWLVSADDFSQGNQEFVKITGDAVNIRQFSNADSEIMGIVYKDTELEVLYRDGDWYQVLYMGQVAWIHADYVEKLDTPTPNTNEESNSSASVSEDSFIQIGSLQANIRSLPSMDGEVIFVADPEQQLGYIETEGSWYHVRIDDNTTGYVADTVSTLEANETTAEEPPEDEANATSTESAEAQYARTVTSIAEATIVVDAGHGGKDPGAISSDQKIYEKDIALSTALQLRDRLQDAGVNVILTRSEDNFVSLGQRVEIGHANNADAFISLHYDTVEAANSMSGTTTYYGIEANRELAETVNRYLAQNTPLPNNGVRLADYHVLRTNKQPAILLELGYMNNDSDTQYISTSAYQASIVEAIYQGLREYYGQ